MSKQPYAFIDGNYLLDKYTGLWRKIYDEDGELDFDSLKLGMTVIKAFFYDAVIKPKPLSANPTAEERQKFDTESSKQQAREELHSKIQRIGGYHVRNGTARRRNRKGEAPIEQKEVDVLLAVESMTHAFRGNTRSVVLVTGDLDFRPLIDALVDMGIYVVLWAENGASTELIDAADEFFPLSYMYLYSFSTSEVKLRCPQIYEDRESFDNKVIYWQAQGKYSDKEVTFGKLGFSVPEYLPGGEVHRTQYIAKCDQWDHVYRSHDPEALKRYVSLVKGVTWD